MNNQQQPGNYSAMPPPPSLTGNNAPVNFNDALSKARAIAEKLKSQNPTGPTPTPPAAGMKRNYREDSYEEEYEPQSSSYRDGDYYDDQRDAKRGMYNRYESTSSRPRYGLGSEERKSSMGGGGYGAYGTNTGAGNEGHIQDECSVPNHMVGLVIGKGGDSLKKIERMSGAKVQIGPDMQEAERKVKLTGEEDQVKIARDMIQQIVDDGRANEANKYPGGASSRGGDGAPMSSYGPRGGNNYNNDNNQNEGTSMMVPAGKVGLIIGRGGENIRNLEGRSGAKITIVTDNHSDRTGGERCVNISGDTSAVQQAKSLIDEIITDEAHNSTSVAPSRDWNAYRQQHYQSHGDRREGGGDSYGGGGYGGRGGNNDGQDSYGGAGGGGYGRGRYNNDGRYNNNEGRYNNNDRYNNDDEEGEKESVQVPQNAVGFIIGRRGDTVRALQDQSGARIKVDPNGDPNAPERTISIFGNPDAVALAKKLITDKVAEGNANRDRGTGGRYNNDGGGRRGGYRGGFNNDRYGGGHHHHNNRYQQQQYQQQYPYRDHNNATSGGDDVTDTNNSNNNNNAGYDYSQYQQYYAQYGGYDQYQQQGQQQNNQDASATTGGESQTQEGYHQYGNYGYPSYEGYGQSSSYGAKNENEDENKTLTKGQEQQEDPQDGGSNSGNNNKDDQATADYYAQYYGGQQQDATSGNGGGSGVGEQQPQQQWTQEAYNQWYQQYYGQYPSASSYPSQEQGQDQPQQAENEQNDTSAPVADNNA